MGMKNSRKYAITREGIEFSLENVHKEDTLSSHREDGMGKIVFLVVVYVLRALMRPHRIVRGGRYDWYDHTAGGLNAGQV
jgi:hypothetical protein